MQAERTDMNTIDKFNSHIMGSYGRLNVVLDKGEMIRLLTKTARCI